MTKALRVSDIGEFGLIQQIRDILEPHSPGVLVGLGDDAATIKPETQPLVITTDTMLEGSHFLLKWSSPENLAHKALASNLSDLAAKSARPLYAVMTLGLPPRTEVEWVLRFYRKVKSLQAIWNVEVIGGDTVLSDKILVSVTLWGTQTTAEPIVNQNAMPGDTILVTGTLGDALAGYELLSGTINQFEPSYSDFLRALFLCPIPRIQESLNITKTISVSSMTDISDGMARDLRKICAAANAGAHIQGGSLPCSDALKNTVGDRAVPYAWKGGEDYELLFTASPENASRLLAGWDQTQCRLTAIGSITDREAGIVVDGWEGPLDNGFDHFLT